MAINNYALIIGAAKCGTTSLFNYLAEHPQISACSQKEPRFFSRNFSKGFEYYQSLWDWNPTIHKIALEATPNYTRVTSPKVSNAAENIAKMQAATNTKFKFIYLMRDPIERIESHYTHAQITGTEPRIKPISEEINSEIIDISRYAMQIEEYYKRFSRDSILLLKFDELKFDPANLLRKVCQFLDIDANFNFKGGHTIYNSQDQIKEIIFPGWPLLKKSKLKKSITALLPHETKKSFRMLLATKKGEYVKLSSKQRNYVLNELRDDLKKLNLEYGVDVSHWNIKN